jgi:3-isopropylmalate dehydrogenase
MLLRYSLGQEAAAARVEAAVRKVLAQGLRTPDIAETGKQTVGTTAMGDAVIAAL